MSTDPNLLSDQGMAAARGSLAQPSYPDRRRVTVIPGGPVLVEGPVDLVTDDGSMVSSDRFMVAVCVCRRSRSFPFCDTSHRRRVRQGTEGSEQDHHAD